MSSQNVNRYMAAMVYEEAYSLEFNWQKHLPPEVFEFHNLLWREMNTPIDLHMGVVLPFVGSCLGPKTKGLSLTHPSVLNIFWINIAMSGVGKSLTRHKFISELMDYIVCNWNGKVKNFKISRFTCAGMINSTLCIHKVISQFLMNICLKELIDKCMHIYSQIQIIELLKKLRSIVHFKVWRIRSSQLKVYV